MIARRVGQLLTLVVLVTSATYMLVYLYRWEWNRALVSGLFFVAAEIAVVATSLLRRLRAIEAKIESRSTSASGTITVERIRAAAPPAPDRFAWLRESVRSTNVFVPVLLGAGVVLSLLAHAVERLASATATPLLERRLALRLEPLALPEGGLLASTRGSSAAPVGKQPTGQRLLNRAFIAATILVGVLGTAQLIDLISDATQTRADHITPGTSVEVTFAVETKGRVPDIEETAEALWVACRGVLNRSVLASEPVALAEGTYRLVITPAIGEHARRRLAGCLEDSTLDRTRGRVISLLEVPTSAVRAAEDHED